MIWLDGVVTCLPVLTYLVMYYGDIVLGHISGICPVHIMAYGVLKDFRLWELVVDIVPSIGSHV